MLKNVSVYAHIKWHRKNTAKKFAYIKKTHYLCNRYPENNLFTL